MMQGGGDQEKKDAAPPIPAKYLDVKTSGLKFPVKEGDNPIDINLTD